MPKQTSPVCYFFFSIIIFHNINPNHVEFISGNIKVIIAKSIIFQNLKGRSSSNASSWKTRDLFNTMAADGLAMQGSRASAAMVLSWFSKDIPEYIRLRKAMKCWIHFNDLCGVEIKERYKMWNVFFFSKQCHIWHVKSHTLVGNKIVDNSDVVGASPVGAAPITSSFQT